MDDRKIEEFVACWFKGMDHMEDVEYFLPYIGELAEFYTPEGLFRGPEGFRLWYGSLRELVKPDNKHDILRSEVTKEGMGYRVDLDILVEADTYGGGVLHLRVKEQWKVSQSMSEGVIIEEYRITEVETL